MRRGAGAFSWCLGLVLLVACAGEPAEKPPLAAVTFESGSRLRANVFVTAEGNEIFVDFYDRELDLDCSFEETVAGFRCLPPHSLDMELRFGDEECTTPVGVIKQEACLPKSPFLVARGESASCPALPGGPVTAFYRAAKVHSGEPVWKGAPGGCQGPLFDTFAWRDLEELPLEDFATAEEQLARASDGLATRMLVSGDGAKVAIGLVDEARAAACTVYSDRPDEPGRCVPASAAVMTERTILVGDCDSDTAAITSPRGCAPPTELIVDRSATCLQSLLFAAGAPVSAENAVFTGNFDCQELGLALPGEVEVTPLGERVDVTEFPAVRSRPSGVGRVTTRVAASENGNLLALPVATSATPAALPMFDEQLGQPCAPMQDEDGVWRCVSGPGISPETNIFSDPGCASPVVIVEPCRFGVPSIGFHAQCGLGPVTGAFIIGAPAPQVYVSSPPDCFLIGVVPNAFVVTGERDVSEFPTLEKTRK